MHEGCKKKVTSSRSRTGATPSRTARALDVTNILGCAPRLAGSIARRARRQFVSGVAALAGRETLLDRLDQARADIGAKLQVELTDAGGARDVDFRDEAADHIEAHEQHATLVQPRADLARKASGRAH